MSKPDLSSSPVVARLLVALCVLQAATLWAMLAGNGGPAVLPPASAAPPAVPADAGLQRAAIADGIAATNAKLDKLLELLQSGQLQVRVVKPDDGTTK